MTKEVVPHTDNMEVVRQRFERAFDHLYRTMVKAPSFHVSSAMPLVNITLSDGRLAQLKLTLTAEEEEIIGDL